MLLQRKVAQQGIKYHLKFIHNMKMMFYTNGIKMGDVILKVIVSRLEVNKRHVEKVQMQMGVKNPLNFVKQMDNIIVKMKTHNTVVKTNLTSKSLQYHCILTFISNKIHCVLIEI